MKFTPKRGGSEITTFVQKSFQASYHWVGLIPFEESLKMQEVFKSSAGKSHLYFFGFESDQPVITLGLRSNSDHIVWTQEQLKSRDITILNIKRGGEATLHAPGQLVIYPVVHLPSLNLKVRDWIKLLEHITKAVLEDLGLLVWQEGKYAGLYTKKGKIAFFGIHISKGLSQHGLSINVNNDLSLFEAIRSCGEKDRAHDKLLLYPKISLNAEELFFKWCDKALALIQKRPSLS